MPNEIYLAELMFVDSSYSPPEGEFKVRVFSKDMKAEFWVNEQIVKFLKVRTSYRRDVTYLITKLVYNPSRDSWDKVEKKTNTFDNETMNRPPGLR